MNETPQELLFNQQAMAIFAAAGVVVEAALLVVVFVVTPVDMWVAGAVPVVVIAAAVIPTVAMLLLNLTQTRSLKAHILGSHHHVCQCYGCGTGLTAVGPTQPMLNQSPPQERLAKRRAFRHSGLALMALALLVYGGLTVAVTAGAVSGSPLAAVIALTGLVIGGFTTLINLGGQLQSPDPHYCGCRWCGAPGHPAGMPVM